MPGVFPVKEHLIPLLRMPSNCSCCLDSVGLARDSTLNVALPSKDSSQPGVSIDFPLCPACQRHLIATEQWKAASEQKELRFWPLFGLGIIGAMWLGFSNASWTAYLGLIVILLVVLVPVQIWKIRGRPRIAEVGRAPGHLRPVDLVRDPLTDRITLQIARDEYARSFEELNHDLLAGGPAGRAAVHPDEHRLLEEIRVCRIVGGLHTAVLARGTPVPAEGIAVLQTQFKGQTSLPIFVFREAGATVKEKDRLAGFEIRDIDPPPDTAAEVEVVVRVATDGGISLAARQLNPDRPLPVDRSPS